MQQSRYESLSRTASPIQATRRAIDELLAETGTSRSGTAVIDGWILYAGTDEPVAEIVPNTQPMLPTPIS